LKQFFDHLGLKGENLEQQGQAFLAKARENNNNRQWIQEQITLYLEFHKKRVYETKELAPGTLKNLYRPIKTFYEAHDDLPTLNWNWIARGLPKAKSYSSSDRAPTVEEIRKIVEYPDRRIKPIVYVMCSSGIRIGAWDYLKWKHVIPIPNEKKPEKIIAAKLIVYAGEPEEYFSFITPEAYNALKEWMDFRAMYGEKITGESWVMRDLWPTTDVKIEKGGNFGLATHPQKLKNGSIKRLLIRAMSVQGIRPLLPEGIRRHEVKGTHGYRKFFKTHAENAMKPINVELLMGHDSGISESYWRPTEKQVLEDYLKAVEHLTINDIDKLTLQKQIAEHTEKTKEEAYIIRGKLAEKEKEIEAAAREAEQTKFLVITSVQESNKYTKLVASGATKQIRLTNAKYGKRRTLTAELYNQGNRKNISLTEMELKIVPKR
jgi:hypothetical protein